ncbi:hypothetical protein ABEF92_004182 [Exophiala dermatitidis]|uniref:RWD domain-containing protein n=1 Tax=Exophiala dermatitidis (strain ATCC 34100 / CBS 525.76 / NIH/UT8656) TaxID=858893 RepID=H6BWK7_EXODN|nr:uncharacterized protein HMPREF1120_04172 [Exophiala dermatitidis NIH/UT8656]EHY56068.1 hypothetical protein HMPREF1120_04172 [Exophiala dermatitidis NIH/UT8656]
MGLEEQKEEREVLDSIFPDEITDISENSFRITIPLDVPSDNHDDESSPTQPPTIILNVTYPESYPDVAPHLDITSPPNAPKHPQLDISVDKSQLLDALQPTIEDSLGMAMVFTLVTTLKEAAEVLISDRIRQAEEARELEVREREEQENRKFHGTMVTRERFLEWREKFRKEMEEKEKKQKEEEEMEQRKGRGPSGGRGEGQKLTGRQLWERGLVGKVDDDGVEDEGDEGVAGVGAGVEKLKVTA